MSAMMSKMRMAGKGRVREALSSAGSVVKKVRRVGE